MPFSPTGYVPQYGDRMIDLLMQQGNAQAQSQMQQGAIWGRALENVGNIAAGAVAQHGEQKAAQKRDAGINEVMQTWDGQDPTALVKGLAQYVGPTEAVKVAGGLQALIAARQKQEPDIKDLAGTVGGIAALERGSPGYIQRNWATLHPVLEPLATKFGMPIGPEWSEDVTKGALTLDQQFNPVKKAEPKVVGDALVDTETGKELYRAQKEVKPDTRDIEARLADAVMKGDTKTAESLLAAQKQLSAASRKPGDGETGTWTEAEGPDGKPVLFNSKTGETKAYPAGVAPKPGTMEKNRRAAAENSIVSGEILLDRLKTDQFKRALGPVTGRYNSLMQAYGDGDPTAVELVGEIKSFAALQPAVHGFRAVQMAKDVEHLLSTKQTAESLAAGIKGILSASYIVAKKKSEEDDGGWVEIPGGRIREKK